MAATIQTIQTHIRLIDNMTPALNAIKNSLRTTNAQMNTLANNTTKIGTAAQNCATFIQRLANAVPTLQNSFSQMQIPDDFCENLKVLASRLRSLDKVVDRINPKLKDMIRDLRTLANLVQALSGHLGLTNVRLRNTGDQLTRFSRLSRTAQVRTRDLARTMRTSTQVMSRYLGLFSRLRFSFLGLGGSIGTLIGGYGALQGALATLRMSDDLTNNRARLAMIADEYNTVESLEKKIEAISNSTFSNYGDTVKLVSSLGLLTEGKFGSNDRLLKFTEQLNKLFTIGGTGADQIRYSMLQLTQALSSGQLRGDELRSILENTPALAQTIAHGIAMNTGMMRKIAAEGKLTTEMVIESVLAMQKETDEKHKKMGVTFGRLWEQFKGLTIQAFKPLSELLSKVSNSKAFQSFVISVASVIGVLVKAVVGAVNWLTTMGDVLFNIWRTVLPILIAVLTPLIAYRAILMSIAAWHGIIALGAVIWKSLTTAITMAKIVLLTFTNVQKAATLAATLFNAAWLACPIVWILLAIIAVVGIAIGLAIYFSDSWQDALTNVAGGFASLFSFIGNILKFFSNRIIAIVEFFHNVWTNPWYSLKKLWIDYVKDIIEIMKGMIGPSDKIITTIVNGFIKGFNMAIKAMLTSIAPFTWLLPKEYRPQTFLEIPEIDSVAGKLDLTLNELDKLLGTQPEGYKSKDKFDYTPTWESFEAGKKFGQGALDKLKDLPETLKKQFNWKADLKDVDSDVNKVLGLLYSIDGNTNKTAKNTSKKDPFEEELRLMRDISYRDSINRFTTAEIKVDMTNNNRIESDRDIDGFTNVLEMTLVKMLERFRNNSAEGVHN